MSAATKHPEAHNSFRNIPSKWEKAEEVFTSDELINAYFKGVDTGKDQAKFLLQTQFNENVKLATDLAEKLYNKIAAEGFKPSEIHLKADNISVFRALIVVKMDDFLKEQFDLAYKFARELREQSETPKFYISFSFIPHSKDLNEACFVSDGYFLKYDKRPVQSKARPA